jgi:nucleotide-binding universal stress UspA family protein
MKIMTTGSRNILVAFDGSECGFNAVSYVGTQFSGLQDIKIRLLHVLPNVPPPLRDDGHILAEAEKEERKRVAEKWLSNQREMMGSSFEKARRILLEKGIEPGRIDTKIKNELRDTAESILEEARTGDYGTLVVGRCGFVHKEPLFMGSTTTRIINKGMGLTICVVE